MLTAESVQEVFFECMFKDGEDTSQAVLVEGIVSKFGFHPGRLAENKEAIHSLLMELPPNFRESDGGGWSFLQACITQTGVQWGEHRNVEQLIALGLASKEVAYLMPREMWSAMPGGMPYFVVKDKTAVVV